MSSKDIVNSVAGDSRKNGNIKLTFKLKSNQQLRELSSDELLAYIKDLHRLMRCKDKELKLCKERIKDLLKSDNLKRDSDIHDSSLCTDEQNALPSSTCNAEESQATNDSAPSTVATASFLAEIRQAAEQAQNLNGFVYEPTSGLYYDQKTGYYYNAEYGLYYDGNTGCYYNYNNEKNSFEFHSQVEVQSSAAPITISAKTTSTSYQRKIGHDTTVDKDDTDMSEVEFDEWGVITDKTKLQKIKESKDKLQKAKRKAKAKKKKEKKKKKKKYKHKEEQASKNKKRRSITANADDADDHADAKKSKTLEDGELSDSSSSSSSSDDSDSETDAAKDAVKVFKGGSHFQDIARKYPPSLRIIVQETNLDALKVGSLSLITFKGGSLGREGNHDVIIPDVNVSKDHLRFQYDNKKYIYKCIDLDSRNGTILNGGRMHSSKSTEQAIPYDLVHGSVIQIAQTKLLCHVHEGNSTCGLCEPGLLIGSAAVTVDNNTIAAMPTLSHKEQLKKLQRKYGLENEKYVDVKDCAGNYNDRAATRRVKVGSSNEHEKTQTASIDTEISSENKGYKMLSKLGWSKGETLGKDSNNASGTNLLEPIKVAGNRNKQGLGVDEDVLYATSTGLSAAARKKFDIRNKTRQRYEMMDIFAEDAAAADQN